MTALSRSFLGFLLASFSLYVAAQNSSSSKEDPSDDSGVTLSWEAASLNANLAASSGTVEISGRDAANQTTTDGVPYNNETHNASHGNRVLAAYYPSYNADRRPLSKIPYHLYNELVFFVATTQNNFTIGLGGLSQNEWDSLAHEFVQRCKQNSVVPTYSLGGWTGSRYFSTLTATPQNRTAYAHSVVDFAKKYGFGGVDIDWEYPALQGIGCNAVSNDDVENYQLFLKEIKTIWPEGKLSTAVNIAGIRAADYSRLPATNLTAIVDAVDQVKIMAYDVHGSWTKTTGPNAPIHATCADPENQLSVETAIEAYLSQGFSPSKLSLGIPGYARSWTLASRTLVPRRVNNYTSYYYQNYTGIPAGGKFDDEPGLDVCGQPVGWGGTWLVSELVENGFLDKELKKAGEGFVRYYDECSGEPFLVGNSKLISYDDTISTVQKVEYAVSKNLSGVFFFDSNGPLESTVAAAKKALHR